MKEFIVILLLMSLMGCVSSSNYSIKSTQGVKLFKTENLSQLIVYWYIVQPEAMWVVSPENLAKIKERTMEQVCSGQTKGKAVFHQFRDVQDNGIGHTQVLLGECQNFSQSNSD